MFTQQQIQSMLTREHKLFAYYKTQITDTPDELFIVKDGVIIDSFIAHNGLYIECGTIDLCTTNLNEMVDTLTECGGIVYNLHFIRNN